MKQKSFQILSDAELDELLRSVKVKVTLPDTFQADVWRRIAVSQEATLSARISHWLAGFVSLLARPVVAVATVLMMISAGLRLGSAGPDAERVGKQAYVHSISPFAEVHEGGHR